ncbi:MAG TPA: transposase, partial [Desulfobulbaceae bacterium]|nr:transposase [Desulfobulbaceae bacterium]
MLPDVLYNGERKWTAATDIVQLVQDVPGGDLSRYWPRLQYLLLSERAYKDDEELHNLNNLVAALFRLENSKNPQQLLDVVVHLLHNG